MAGLARQGKEYQLNGRVGHATVVINDSLYLWCGGQSGLPAIHDSPEKKRVASNIQIFSLPSGMWTTHETKGTPPLGVYEYICSAVADQLYYFGGYCGHDSCYHNSINQLDTRSLTWTELEPTVNDIPVMRRAQGGMITVDCDGVHQLLMIGGYGSPPTTQLPQANYIQLPTERWLTNEHSLYNLSTGDWSNPSITGQCIPPARGFVTEMINNSRAIVFGGTVNKNASNGVYLMEISGSTVFWLSLKKSNPIDQWPVERYNHAAAIIAESATVSPVLVTVGGKDQKRLTLNECWLFDISSRSWTKITLPHFVSERWAHSISAFMLGSHHVAFVVVGGIYNKIDFIRAPNVTVLIELVLSDGQWSVGDIFDSTALSTEAYRQKYLQQFQSGRKEWLEQYHPKPREVETPKLFIKDLNSVQLLEEESQLFLQKLNKSETEKELQEKIQVLQQLLEKGRELHLYSQQLEEKEKALKEKEREVEEKERALQAFGQQLQEERELLLSQETVRIYQQQVNSQENHWVIQRDELTLTEEVLGKGAYGHVKVGVFRGLRVAVKSVRHIISDYNQDLFSTEMDIASRVHHPNLVQFIGATKVGSPLIVTELMSTSLYSELQTKALTRPQIVSISRDVALGLNYLHLWKPLPIIHRDVSSSNVMLEPSVDVGFKAKVTDYVRVNLQQARTEMPANPAYAAPESLNPNHHSPSMDVYSYCVLLMEMSLHRPPAMTVSERQQQAVSLSWSAMNSLVQNGLNINRRFRPTMAQMLDTLNEF